MKIVHATSYKTLLYYLIFVLFLGACADPKAPATPEAPGKVVAAENPKPDTSSNEDVAPKSPAVSTYVFPYDLSRPAKACKLPKVLEEISGLSYLENGNLAIVQDEKGKIFIYSTDSCDLVEDIKFGKSGDYEGIEVLEDTAWVVRSDGIMYKVIGFTQSDPETQKFNTDLSQKNDIEGLGFLPDTRQLLLACKSVPYLGKKRYKNKRAVYAFDLNSNQLYPTPVLLIDLKVIGQYKNKFENDFSRASRELASFFDAGGDLNFQPSAVAVHPVTGNIYVIASVGKLLLVFNSQNEIIAMQPLNSHLFKQPEGMCFSPQGDLFISNEGRGGAANLLTFQYAGNDS